MIRPQLTSSPAMAVLTRGERATVRAAFLASAGVAAPVNLDPVDVPGAFAVGHHLAGQVIHHPVHRLP